MRVEVEDLWIREIYEKMVCEKLGQVDENIFTMENVYTYIKKRVVSVAREVIGKVRISRKKSNALWNNEMTYAMVVKKKAYLEILNGNVKADKNKKCNKVCER